MASLAITNTENSKNYRRLSLKEKEHILAVLLEQSKDGKLKWGSIKAAATSFNTSTRTVRRIWLEAQRALSVGEPVDLSSKAIGRVGRKRVEIDVNDVAKIPLRRRTNLRSLAQALNMPTTIVYRRVKEGLVKPHSDAIKPFLTDQNKKVRLKFCLSMLNNGTLHHNPTFVDMYDYVHIDEKWFFMSKTTERYYLLPSEVEPHRTCKSKRFIPKVMFMAAVARPRFVKESNQFFNGKIGIFPFVYQEPAKRNSKNRRVGTLETKPIASITKEVTRKCLIENILPAIREKWPEYGSKTIYIQQDNAKPHIDSNDAEFLEAARRDGFDIRLTNQPPNSPDLNVLDLGFFRAIQALQYQEAPNTVAELVSAVERSFDRLSPESLNNVFLSLQLCMIEVMKVLGGNNYRLKHVNKNRLEGQGELPTSFSCDQDIVKQALLHLQQ
ncbi:hypothetical protein COLO4_20007 [Corchorus olitorius]|uniref:DUF7769 domain-containing protein n=1 Tax=Corchorus olitorius TaxID=93759 RepID=A0A1R3J2B7_9ROSI|nr:hypothetical protein COLO4_20007 [Corchorus olitorius]